MVGFEIKTPIKTEKPKKVGRVRFEFVMDADKDKKIIEMLNKQANKADYIRRLILEDINLDTQ